MGGGEDGEDVIDGRLLGIGDGGLEYETEDGDEEEEEGYGAEEDVERDSAGQEENVVLAGLVIDAASEVPGGASGPVERSTGGGAKGGPLRGPAERVSRDRAGPRRRRRRSP
jgi:hypothetical protein